MMFNLSLLVVSLSIVTSVVGSANVRSVAQSNAAIPYSLAGVKTLDGACTDDMSPVECGIFCCPEGGCNSAGTYCACPSSYPVECPDVNGCCPSGYSCPSSGSNQCTKKNSATSCFSRTDTVTLQDGSEALLSNLHVGDRVLSLNADGKFTHSEVIFLPHAQNDQESDFVKVTLKSGRTIKMTLSHILPAGDCGSAIQMLPLVAAEQVVPGQCVRSLSGLDEVLTAERVVDYGVYTLITNDEFVVVNGIVASPFGTNHFMANKFYNIHRAIYAMWPAALNSPALKANELTHLIGGIAMAITGSH